MQNRSADFQGLHTRIGSTGMASRQRRLFVTIVIPAICVIGAITSGSRTTLAQTAGHVGATCSVNSDCISGVCHPATHLCMISAAATQPASASYGANPDSSSAVCSAPSDQCMPKASGGTRPRFSANVSTPLRAARNRLMSPRVPRRVGRLSRSSMTFSLITARVMSSMS
jgi:hypothetical protein